MTMNCVAFILVACVANAAANPELVLRTTAGAETVIGWDGSTLTVPQHCRESTRADFSARLTAVEELLRKTTKDVDLLASQHTDLSALVKQSLAKPASCSSDGRFFNCKEAQTAGCADGEYTLKTSNGNQWRTKCSGGKTLIGYIGATYKTKLKASTYTSFPAQSATRSTGDTFVFQGNMADLGANTIFEAVNCASSQTESMSNTCSWVHSASALTTTEQVQVRAYWGYAERGAHTYSDIIDCQIGNVVNTGAVKPDCSAYSGQTHSSAARQTVLGWQVDVNGDSHCWAARGTCCSGAGGSGRCNGHDANGGAYSMLWAGNGQL